MDKLRSTLTGKDTDMIILSNLDDRSLLSLCSVDQYTKELCKNETFWRNRTITKYGNISKYKPIDMSWREFYLKIIIDLNSENGLKDFPNLIVIYPMTDNIIIQHCNDIKLDKILIVTNEIRNEMIFKYIAMGAADSCPICRTKLSEISTTNCTDKCFLKNININGDTFKASVTCPITKGECGHIYHNTCINNWRKKRDTCPLDNQQWVSLEMDSFVTGIVDNRF